MNNDKHRFLSLILLICSGLAMANDAGHDAHGDAHAAPAAAPAAATPAAASAESAKAADDKTDAKPAEAAKPVPKKAKRAPKKVVKAEAKPAEPEATPDAAHADHNANDHAAAPAPAPKAIESTKRVYVKDRTAAAAAVTAAQADTHAAPPAAATLAPSDNHAADNHAADAHAADAHAAADDHAAPAAKAAPADQAAAVPQAPAPAVVPQAELQTAAAPSNAAAEECSLPLKSEIAALFDRWNASLRTGNAKKVVANYAPNSILLPTVSNRARFTAAEKEDYFVHFLQRRPEGRIDDRMIEVDCNSASDAGLYTFRFADGTSVKARYTFAYRKIGNEWLITSHHSSAMPEKPEAAVVTASDAHAPVSASVPAPSVSVKPVSASGEQNKGWVRYP